MFPIFNDYCNECNVNKKFKKFTNYEDGYGCDTCKTVVSEYDNLFCPKCNNEIENNEFGFSCDKCQLIWKECDTCSDLNNFKYIWTKPIGWKLYDKIYLQPFVWEKDIDDQIIFNWHCDECHANIETRCD